jgi:hypothetical protein
MTAAEKAKSLIDKFSSKCSGNSQTLLNRQLSKQCAIIAVDEFTQSLKPLFESNLNNDFDLMKVRGYWLDVRQEINKLKTQNK